MRNQRQFTAMLFGAAAMFLLFGPASHGAANGATASSVMIDANAESAPISKYVYGQFIEHLGRCIYGGIWAEMLEDRKFFLDVGVEGSPWRGVPNSGSVEMSKENVFVGDHVPLIHVSTLGDGIAQIGLALEKGRDYVGYVSVAGTSEAGPVTVAVAYGDAPEIRQVVATLNVASDYVKTPFSFTAQADSDNAELSITGAGKGDFRLGTISLMPADNVSGMRKDTLELLRELDAPVYRWPGGNFVSGYNWRDGIGDRDRRPPRKNPAWKGIEHNDFGIDEYMVFCRMLMTDSYIAVNSGLGDSANAAAEVQYANGSVDTPMGKLRAENGHSEPYKVTFWSVGNEMYGDWQLGHIPLDEYVKRHNAFADALLAEDPTIKLVGVGSTGDWSKSMLSNCADHMDYLSEHFYCQEKKDLLEHVRQIPDNVRKKAEEHRKYLKDIPSLANKKIPIALDEWNYWYGADIFGELGTRYFLKDALGIAAGLHEYYRNSDIFFMANYAQTVNVIGAIKTNKTSAAFETTGLVLRLYRQSFGAIPVKVENDAAPLDVMAAWRDGRKTLTVGVVNPTDKEKDVALSLNGAILTGTGMLQTISGNDPYSFNEPGKEPMVKIEQTLLNDVSDVLKVAPLSVNIFALDVK